MELPDLPKTHKKQEANFGVKFRHVIEKYELPSCPIELKHTRGKESFPFDEVKDTQIAYGLQAQNGSLIRVQGVNGELDYAWFKNAPSFVAICYPKGIVVIRMEDFIKEKKESKGKSLYWDRANKIALKIRE